MNDNNWPLYKHIVTVVAFVFVIISLYILLEIDVREVIICGVEKNYQTLYLLSAIAQSLSAILAIVVTITLIIVQISYRYSLPEEIIDIYFYIYFALYIVTIIVALWQLSEPNKVLVKSCLILTSGCLLFLIPFFIYMRERINLEPQIKNLTQMAVQKLLH